ncbi:hypothetical protein IFR05_009271 [Cadophora sp. M221]|nr:hypothetical protein IFR05_009271 [Cadophora sp. M221]
MAVESPRTALIERVFVNSPYSSTPVVCTLLGDNPRLYSWSHLGAVKTINIHSDHCELGAAIDMMEFGRKREEESRHAALLEYGRLKCHMGADRFERWLKETVGWDDKQIADHDAAYEAQERKGDLEKKNDLDNVNDECHQTHLMRNNREHTGDQSDEEEYPPYRDGRILSLAKSLFEPPKSSRWKAITTSGNTLLHHLTRTLEVDLGGRPGEPYKSSSSGVAKNTRAMNDVPTLLPEPNMAIDKEEAITSIPGIRQPQEHEQEVTWIESITVRTDVIQNPSYNDEPRESPITTAIKPSSQVARTASFRKSAYPEEGVPYAYEVTAQPTQTPSCYALFPSASSSDYWSAFDFNVRNPFSEFSMPEIPTAVVGQSVPTPTSTLSESQRSKFTKAELRKRNDFNEVEVIEINSTEVLKITTASVWDISVSSTNPTTLNLKSGPKPELHKRYFSEQLEKVEENPSESSKISSAIPESSTPSTGPTTIQLDQQVNSKSELQKRHNWDDRNDWNDDWDDYGDWYERVVRDRKEYLFNERQTLREAYEFQRPGGRTLKGARLEDNSPFRWILEGAEIPDEINCRLDDMTEAPGPRNRLCDPTPLHPTGPQISSSENIIPFSNPFAILLLFLIFFILPCNRNATPAASTRDAAASATGSDSDNDGYHYNSDSDTDSDDGFVLDAESQFRAWESLQPPHPWRGIEEHLRRSGMMPPDYDDLLDDGEDYGYGNEDWV